MLRTELVAALELEDGLLENLHGSLPGFSPSAEHHKNTMAAKEALLLPFADPKRYSSFLDAYDAIVCSVLAPALAESLGTELTSLWYACLPTLRVQTPSSNLATIRPHCDGMYGLQPGSVNYWLPLTRVSSSSALWVETEEGMDGEEEEKAQTGEHEAPFAYHALTRPTRFEGRGRIHFTVPNRSPHTRVSLDLRCVPGHLYIPDARLSKLGYFSLAERSRGGHEWTKTRSGRVSKLHGLPHAGEPREVEAPL